MAGGCSVVKGWGTSWYRRRLVLKAARLGPRSSETCSSANLKGQRLIQISFRKGFKRPQKDLVHDYPPKRNHCLPGVCCYILFYQYHQLLRCIWNKYKMSIPRRHSSLPRRLNLKFSNSDFMSAKEIIWGERPCQGSALSCKGHVRRWSEWKRYQPSKDWGAVVLLGSDRWWPPA